MGLFSISEEPATGALAVGGSRLAGWFAVPVSKLDRLDARMLSKRVGRRGPIGMSVGAQACQAVESQ
jgi:hypothetical protein